MKRFILLLSFTLFGPFSSASSQAEKTARSTLIFYDSFSAKHDRQGHLEGAWRLDVLEKVVSSFAKKKPNYVVRNFNDNPTIDQRSILDVHSESYVTKLKAQSASKSYLCAGRWCPYLERDTYQVAARASSMAVRAVQLVHSGKHSNAFALTRPPGHHASRDGADGFCVLNHAVIAARHLVTQLNYGRVAIVDLDTHHGDGSESLSSGDPKIRFMSLHQHPAWPFTGAAAEAPDAKGAPLKLNFPIAPGSSSSIHLKRIQDKMMTSLDLFKPEFIIVSAGYDLHWRDPLGALDFTSSDIAELHKSFVEYANAKTGGRIVFVLEGGYNKEALSEGVSNTLFALQGLHAFQDQIGRPDQK